MDKNKTINVSLDRAREWYNGSNESLRKLALEAFSKDELTTNFKNIKTFKDACETLGYNYNITMTCVTHIATFSKASAAMFKLNIVRKALNLGYDLHLTKDPEGTCIYYPYNPFVTKSSTYYDDDLSSGEQKVIGKIKTEGEEYDILGGCATDGCPAGLGCFYPTAGVGYAESSSSIFGCANEEIAEHFSKYFGMLITEAKFGDLQDFEIIEDKYNCIVNRLNYGY